MRIVGYLSYAVLAAPYALLGVAWSGIRRDLDLPVEALLVLAVPLTVARACGGITAPMWLRRIGPASTATAALVIIAGGTALLAVSDHWAPAAAATAVIGYGAGLVESTWSVVIPLHHGARFITRLHGAYGAGAVVAPLVLTALGGSDAWAWTFVAVGAVALIAAVGVRLVRDDIGTVHSTGAIGPATVARAAITGRRWTVVALSAASLEVTASQWGPTLLEDRAGLGDTAVGVTSSAFWAAITIVRLLGPTIARARPIAPLAIQGMVLSATAAFGLLLDPLAPVALVAIGAGSALVFPTLVGATATRSADPAVGVGAVFLAGSVGGTSAPAIAGGVVALTGLGAVALLLSGTAVAAAITARRALLGAAGDHADGAGRQGHAT